MGYIGAGAERKSICTFRENASIYAFAPEFLEKDLEKTILEYNCRIVKMMDYLVLDIDSEEDFRLMSMLIEYFGQKDAELGKVIALAKEL